MQILCSSSTQITPPISWSADLYIEALQGFFLNHESYLQTWNALDRNCINLSPHYSFLARLSCSSLRHSNQLHHGCSSQCSEQTTQFTWVVLLSPSRLYSDNTPDSLDLAILFPSVGSRRLLPNAILSAPTPVRGFYRTFSLAHNGIARITVNERKSISSREACWTGPVVFVCSQVLACWHWRKNHNGLVQLHLRGFCPHQLGYPSQLLLAVVPPKLVPAPQFPAWESLGTGLIYPCINCKFVQCRGDGPIWVLLVRSYTKKERHLGYLDQCLSTTMVEAFHQKSASFRKVTPPSC